MVEQETESKLLIPSCREFSAAVNDAVDRRTERMYREAEVSRYQMKQFFYMLEKSITSAEFSEFQTFVQLAIQQLVIGAVLRMYKQDKKVSLANVVKRIESGSLDIDGGTAVYHDIMHTLMARLMSKGGRDVATLRPVYQRREGSLLHFLISSKGEKHSELNNMEERLATFFFNNNHRVSQVIKDTHMRVELSEQEKIHVFLTRVFITSGEITRAQQMPQVVNFITKMFESWDSNPRALFDEYKKLMQGLL